MIRFFRTYQKTVFAILIFIVVAMVLSTIGSAFMQQGGSDGYADRPAVAINDTKIPRSEFEQRKRAVESQYQRMFGDQYQQIVQQFGLNTAQNVVDGLIDNTLLANVAREKNFAAPDGTVMEAIQKQFPGGYRPEALGGLSPEKFLKDTEDQVLIEQISKLLEQTSIPSNQEIHDRYLQNQSLYDIEYIVFDPKNAEKTLPASTNEAIAAFFESNKERYRTKPMVAFNYVSFDPEKFFDAIEVPQEEIEFYYTENQKEFTVPESAKVKQIQFLFPKEEEDPKKLAEVREKAEKTLEKAKAGENFESLARLLSDDVTTKSTGGDLGWVPKGRYKKNFDEKVFSDKKAIGDINLIESEFGFQIVKTEEFRDASLKSLDEVRDEITKKLKSEQAPGIADASARDFYDAFFAAEGVSLEEFAKDKKVTVVTQTAPLSEEQDAAGLVPGITKKIMENLPEQKQLVEDKKTSFVVEVTKTEEAVIPDLSLVKPEVIKAVTAQNAIIAARKNGEDALTEIKNGKSFTDIAAANQLKVQTLTGVKKGEPKAPFSDSEELQNAAFTVSETYPTAPTSVVAANDNFYIVRTIKRTVPDFSAAKAEDIEKITGELKEEKTSQARKALLDELKKKSKIDIDPTILR